MFEASETSMLHKTERQQYEITFLETSVTCLLPVRKMDGQHIAIMKWYRRSNIKLMLHIYLYIN